MNITLVCFERGHFNVMDIVTDDFSFLYTGYEATVYYEDGDSMTYPGSHFWTL